MALGRVKVECDVPIYKTLDEIGPREAAAYFGKEILDEFPTPEILEHVGREEAKKFWGLEEPKD